MPPSSPLPHLTVARNTAFPSPSFSRRPQRRPPLFLLFLPPPPPLSLPPCLPIKTVTILHQKKARPFPPSCRDSSFHSLSRLPLYLASILSCLLPFYLASFLYRASPFLSRLQSLPASTPPFVLSRASPSLSRCYSSVAYAARTHGRLLGKSHSLLHRTVYGSSLVDCKLDKMVVVC
ncbi:hypothetical protein TIFTF001_037732 [Ficus carica]|uniref:Uncharacterized protein n=1 Tax=Ficus carica TaxID=3494 RepID=A0AA88JCZ5_FICCA|nr:hypothetical protein TIFTF001_037732 [Ficus carica]